MSRFSDPQTEWRVSEIESKLREKADSHELTSLQRDLDRLESSLRGAISEFEVVRSELESAKELVTRLEQRVIELENRCDDQDLVSL